MRCTPIEYTYREGALYLLSEGGERFAHLMLNRQVSVAVYNKYTGMASLGGVQITGTAAIVDQGSTEYAEILELKGLNPDQFVALPMDLNLIRIDIRRGSCYIPG